MIHSRRRLPHWVPDDVPVFVTFRLAGSLPNRVCACAVKQATGGARFVAADSELDRAALGPVWLRDTRVADMMIDALQHGASVKRWYLLHAFVIMPNHVHLVWTPSRSMTCVLRWFKSATAKRAKRLLGLSVKAFWQEESYDHWIRTEQELQKTIRYVEWNPVKAGLVRSVEEWRWSSAHRAIIPETRTARPSAPLARQHYLE